VDVEERNIYWRPWEEPGLEHLHLVTGPDGVRAIGLILRKRGEAHLRCRYELDCDPEWRTRRLRFAVTANAGAPATLVLEAKQDATWLLNGEPRPELDGCPDVDIQVTPFTNSLPLRRLRLPRGESADIRVIYVPVPDLAARAVDQRYTCLEPMGRKGGLYRYEGLFRDFTADLPVDADGLVIDYRDTFARVWPR